MIEPCLLCLPVFPRLPIPYLHRANCLAKWYLVTIATPFLPNGAAEPYLLNGLTFDRRPFCATSDARRYRCAPRSFNVLVAASSKLSFHAPRAASKVLRCSERARCSRALPHGKFPIYPKRAADGATVRTAAVRVFGFGYLAIMLWQYGVLRGSSLGALVNGCELCKVG